jgi:UDP-N-acetylmuramoyl-tripeptide--D-alanyl-D-alanine ligase
MATEKGEDGFDRVDGHTSRGNAAFCLESTNQGELIVLRLGSRKMPVLYTHLVPATFGGRARMNVANALAAAAAGLACDVPLDAVALGLASAQLSRWRMELSRTPSGALVLNDAYNANPTSVAAALESLATLDARRRVAVLGVMAELGPESDDEHARIGKLAGELGVDVIAVDAPAYGVDKDVADVDAALDALAELRLATGDAVLVKGSRVAGLERVAAALTGIEKP